MPPFKVWIFFVLSFRKLDKSQRWLRVIYGPETESEAVSINRQSLPSSSLVSISLVG